MTKERDALLAALYVLVDDHVVAPRAGRGRQPLLSDSELIALAVVTLGPLVVMSNLLLFAYWLRQ